MKPLNYAILKHFTKVEQACANDVIAALKPVYGNFKALNEKDVLNALLTAEANGLIEEKYFELNAAGNLDIYYFANEDGKATINKYIKD